MLTFLLYLYSYDKNAKKISSVVFSGNSVWNSPVTDGSGTLNTFVFMFLFKIILLNIALEYVHLCNYIILNKVLSENNGLSDTVC